MTQRCIGYMLTWTTYGSWLQGDARGYTKDKKQMGPNPAIYRANLAQLAQPQVTLTQIQQDIITDAINTESQTLGQKIHAVAVGRHHIHLVTSCGQLTAQQAVAHYKVAAHRALKANGFEGKLWTRSFSKRFCFDEEQIRTVIKYVAEHNKD